MNKTLVLYHANCADGFTSAWIAHSVLGDTATYIPVNYGEPPPQIDGEDVYILDFSYKRDIMKEISRKANYIVVLDHHKTAKEELEGVQDELSCGSYIKFDMAFSGAMLAWHNFWQTSKEWAQKKKLVEYVQDRDLWRFQLENSLELNTAFDLYERTFKNWDWLSDTLHSVTGVAKLFYDGELVLQHKKVLTQNILQLAHPINLGGYSVKAVNSCVFFSDLAGELAKTNTFGVAYFNRGHLWQFSLRSQGEFDVSQVAQKYGGGGHKNAAGFELTQERFKKLWQN